MLGPARDDVGRGWIVGIIVGTLIVRRADRRGVAVDRDEIVERWSPIGAGLGAAVAVLRTIS